MALIKANINLFLGLSNMSSMEKLDLLKAVGRNVKTQRELKEISQVTLVGLMNGNIDTTNISRIESGRTNPTIFTLYRIAQALKIPLETLVTVEPKESIDSSDTSEK